MSDGNFNRALLPSTPYRSGLKMGQQMAMKQAKEAFTHILDTHFPHLDEEKKSQLLHEFVQKLTRKE